MATTFSFTPKLQQYTIAEINALFRSIADVVDGKVDARSLNHQGPIYLNGQPIINLVDAVASTDLITYRQMKERLATPFQKLPPELQRFHTKMIALRENKSSRVDVVAWGPSSTEGQWSYIDKRWTQLLAKQVRLMYGLSDTGSQWYTTNNIPPGGTGAPFDEPWVRTGAVAALAVYGGGCRSVSIGGPANPGSIRLAFTGTSLDLYYGSGPNVGTMRYVVDGGAPVDVVTTETVYGVVDEMVTIGPLSPGAHNIVISCTAGNAIVVSGAYVYNGDEAAGFHVRNLGHGGFKEYDWVTTRTLLDFPNQIVHHPADLIIIGGCGANAYLQNPGRTLEQVRVDLSQELSLLRQLNPDADLLIEQHYEVKTNADHPEGWAPWLEMVAEVAEEFGAALYNTNNVIGKMGIGNPYDSGDHLHPNDAGYAVIASVIKDKVVPNPGLKLPTAPAVPTPLTVEQDLTLWDEVDSAGNPATCAAVLQGYTLSDASPVYRLTDASAGLTVARQFTLPALIAGSKYRFTVHINPRTFGTALAPAVQITLNQGAFGCLFRSTVPQYSEYTLGGTNFTNEFLNGERIVGFAVQSDLHVDMVMLGFEFVSTTNQSNARILLAPTTGAGVQGSLDFSKPTLELVPEF